MAGYAEKDQFIKVGDVKLDVSIIEPKQETKGSALFLHGGGEISSKETYLPLARAFAGQGYRCLIFSFPGHGKSGGKITGSSLAKRTEIARALAKELGFLPSTLLLGFSMGVHNALRLLSASHDPFPRLALFVPAIYSAEAEDIEFSPKFSEIIRRPGSYENSLVLRNLREYRGKLAVFQAGKDKVIPPEVIDLISKNAVSASSNDKVYFKDSPHGIGDWICENEKRLTSVVKALDTFDFSELKQFTF